MAIIKKENEVITARVEFIDFNMFVLPWKNVHNVCLQKFTTAPHNFHVAFLESFLSVRKYGVGRRKSGVNPVSTPNEKPLLRIPD